MLFLKNPFKKTSDFDLNLGTPPSAPSKTEGIIYDSGAKEGKFLSVERKNAKSSLKDRLMMVYCNRIQIENGTLEPVGHVIRESTKKRKKTNGKDNETKTRINKSPTIRQNEGLYSEGSEEATELYRPLSMNMSKKISHENRILFKDIDFASMSPFIFLPKIELIFLESNGEILNFRARIHTVRRMSAKMVFIVFRQQTITIQGILQSFVQPEDLQKEQEGVGLITESMVRCIEHYASETIVIVRAKLRRALKWVKNTTIHDYEFEIYEVHKLAELSHSPPFTVYDAENISRGKNRENSRNRSKIEGKGKGVSSSDDFMDAAISEELSLTNQSSWSFKYRRNSARMSELSDHTLGTESTGKSFDRSLPQRVRLNNRVLDLRTGPSQAIFRIQSGINNLFRSYLDTNGFIEVHTPKLQGAATESGALLFELNYFARPAFLAQSPQFSKQMCIIADFERVYEIGPVFRAEDSNTPRHLTEYISLDLEMTIEEHYHEALTIIDEMFKSIWQGIYDRYQTEIDLISQFFPHDKIQWLEQTPHLSFSEGIELLKEDGWVDDEGNTPSEYEDLSTQAEARLGRIIKDKYKTDYYIVDKFPASARPFYTMPDPSDERITNSFDIFLRGQEILSGGQRIHDAKFLEKQMKMFGVRPESVLEYFEGFCLGAPPHAGCGIGLERLTYLFLNLGNIRLASLFPRDPKSLPLKAPLIKLRHEEASTINPPWEGHDLNRIEDLQPLEKLIANYGDAANTSWLDSRYHVWRHFYTGAAQGYAIYNNFAIIVGEPLCAVSQYHHIIPEFLHFIQKEKKLKPVWIIVGSINERFLAEKYSWRTLGCIAEERLKLHNNPALKDKDLTRKIRHAQNEGVKEIDITFGQPVPQNLRAQIDERIQEWRRGRKGTQIHLTQIRPWIDEEHRRYFYSRTSDGVIHAFVVLHQLSPKNGYQIKFSLEFPGAPSGTIESLILHSLRAIALSDPDIKEISFGTGATSTLECGRNLGKTKSKTLKRIYESLSRQLGLRNKSEFRLKLGVRSDPVYVCYPQDGLGLAGIMAILGFLQED
ncbi:Aspartate--tRNA ligase, cytoplasmic [Podosphaera aphanis]|nr:Aspartate--tRNA ligase, cytoplasmic [Podosphaera aphanis]